MPGTESKHRFCFVSCDESLIKSGQCRCLFPPEGVEYKDERESPCEVCEDGEMVYTETRHCPDITQDVFTCNACGHQRCYP